MEHANRLFLSTRLLAVTAITATLCLTLTSPSPAKSDQDYVIKLGYYNCDHMTAAPVAYDSGIFEKLGLKVDITGTGKVPEAMAAGKMDVGYIGFQGMLQAIEKGSPMVTVAGKAVSINNIYSYYVFLGRMM